MFAQHLVGHGHALDSRQKNTNKTALQSPNLTREFGDTSLNACDLGRGPLWTKQIKITWKNLGGAKSSATDT